MPKHLKPTLRERNRYLAFEVDAEGPLDRKPVVDAVWGSLMRLHGELGAAKTSLWVMDWDPAKRRGVIKTNHMGTEILRSSIALVREIDGKKAAVHVRRSSGTLRGARERL
jgi:ribonuclease P/MRP protein subunit POP5